MHPVLSVTRKSSSARDGHHAHREPAGEEVRLRTRSTVMNKTYFALIRGAALWPAASPAQEILLAH